MRLVGCVAVTTAKAFTFLGHMPVMNWAVTQLLEIRGLDAVVCVTTPDLIARAKKLLAAEEEVRTVAIPRTVLRGGDDALDAWLVGPGGPAEGADLVLALRPTCPFLPAAKLEACVEEVRRGRCALCVPARPVKVAGYRDGRRSRLEMPEAVEAARAFRAGAVRDPVKTIAVDLVESLDVTDPGNHRLAEALVSGGLV